MRRGATFRKGTKDTYLAIITTLGKVGTMQSVDALRTRGFAKALPTPAAVALHKILAREQHRAGTLAMAEHAGGEVSVADSGRLSIAADKA